MLMLMLMLMLMQKIRMTYAGDADGQKPHHNTHHENTRQHDNHQNTMPRFWSSWSTEPLLYLDLHRDLVKTLTGLGSHLQIIFLIIRLG